MFVDHCPQCTAGYTFQASHAGQPALCQNCGHGWVAAPRHGMPPVAPPQPKTAYAEFAAAAAQAEAEIRASRLQLMGRVLLVLGATIEAIALWGLNVGVEVTGQFDVVVNWHLLHQQLLCVLLGLAVLAAGFGFLLSSTRPISLAECGLLILSALIVLVYLMTVVRTSHAMRAAKPPLWAPAANPPSAVQ